MKDNLPNHDRAADIRVLAEGQCIDHNETVEREAVDDFEGGETARYFREHADYLIGRLVTLQKAVADRQPIPPLRRYDAECLVRLISTCTEAEVDTQWFDDSLPDDETIEAWKDNDLVHDGYMTSVNTPTTGLQNLVHAALRDYALAAASYARHIASDSLLSWAEILDILENRVCFSSRRVTQDDAVRLIELEKSASTRLRLDRIIADLPPFAPRRTKPRKKAK